MIFTEEELKDAMNLFNQIDSLSARYFARKLNKELESRKARVIFEEKFRKQNLEIAKKKCDKLPIRNKKWIADESPNVNGQWAIREDNGQVNVQPIATVCKLEIAELIVNEHNYLIPSPESLEQFSDQEFLYWKD